jgi:hypothetical protein
MPSLSRVHGSDIYWKPATCSPDCSAPRVPILHQDFTCLSSTTHACAGYNSRTRWSSVFRPSGGLRFLPVRLRENAWRAMGATAPKPKRWRGPLVGLDHGAGQVSIPPTSPPADSAAALATGVPPRHTRRLRTGSSARARGAALPRGRRGPPLSRRLAAWEQYSMGVVLVGRRLVLLALRALVLVVEMPVWAGPGGRGRSRRRAWAVLFRTIKTPTSSAFSNQNLVLQLAATRGSTHTS